MAVIPATAAPVVETTSTTFQATCRAVPSAFSEPSSDGKPSTVRVSASAVVALGRVFDIDLDPGSVQIPNDVSGAIVKKISRLKIDLPIPANAEFVSATVTDPGNVVAGKPASVVRVNEDGTPVADGPTPIVRRKRSDRQQSVIVVGCARRACDQCSVRCRDEHRGHFLEAADGFTRRLSHLVRLGTSTFRLEIRVCDRILE